MNAAHYQKSLGAAFPGISGSELDERGATWTAREIAQQPDVWLQVAQQIGASQTQIDSLLRPLLAEPALRIVLTGAGTSAFIGNCLAPALAAHLQRRVDAVPTTDIVSAPASYLADDVPTLLVSFARSGNSPESLATIELAEQTLSVVHHLIITCNAEGALAKRAGQLRSALSLVLPDATNDRSFAMTSSFSSMVLAAAVAFGLISQQRVLPLSQAAAGLLERAWPLAQRLASRGFHRVVYLGSGELRGLASEAALKLLELSDGRVVALSESTLGFRHGPKTVIDERTLVVLMLSNDSYTRAFDLDLLRELSRDGRAGSILALGTLKSPDDQNSSDDTGGSDHLELTGMSDASDLEIALLAVVVAQTYALLQSLALGLTPDRPNASGVVNRVVQGVIIHPWRSGQ
jgi:tagatose-6-phosphate ketose/aldose isomerase